MTEEMTISLAEDIAIILVRIPAGKFLMGTDLTKISDACPDQLPQHSVILDEYFIGKFPVTCRQYKVFLKETGYRAPEDWSYGEIPEGKDNHPVIHVSWKDAQAFCLWVSQRSELIIRLPSEAEWEKAARGIEGQFFPWGDDSPDEHLLNFSKQVGGTTPVDQYPDGASPYGILDMVGNAWEWVSDWYDSHYYAKSPVLNPLGPASGKAHSMRGGCWANKENGVTAATRGMDLPGGRFGYYSFRVAS